jgi:hypothetical protein
MAKCAECGNPYAHTLMDDDWYCEECLSGIHSEEMDEPSDHEDEDWNFCDRCGCYLTDALATLCDHCQAVLGR